MANIKPSRNVFDSTFDAVSKCSELLPVKCMEVIPSNKVTIDSSIIVRAVSVNTATLVR